MGHEKVAPSDNSQSDEMDKALNEIRENIARVRRMHGVYTPSKLASLSAEQRLALLESRITSIEQSFMAAQVAFLRRELQLPDGVAEELLRQIVLPSE